MSKEYQKKYKKDNKERLRIYRENNKEKIKQRKKKYREDNKEKIKESTIRYIKNNKEKIKEIQKRYYDKPSSVLRRRKKHPLIIKECKLCHKQFETSFYRSIYCYECKEYKKTKEYKNRNMKEKECELCGEKFMSVDRIKRFCSKKCCMKVAIKRCYTRRLLEEENYREKTRLLTRNNYKRIKEYINNFKKDKKCFECGWNEFPVILQFHHRDKTKKKGTISMMRGLKNIKEEIKKCDLICPNCHVWEHNKNKYL